MALLQLTSDAKSLKYKSRAVFWSISLRILKGRVSAQSAEKLRVQGNFGFQSLDILSALQNWLPLNLPFSRDYSHPPYDSHVVHTPCIRCRMSKSKEIFDK